MRTAYFALPTYASVNVIFLCIEIVDDDVEDNDKDDDYDSSDDDEDDDDDSTWNMELPNVADLSIDSSTTDVQGTTEQIHRLIDEFFPFKQFFCQSLTRYLITLCCGFFLDVVSEKPDFPPDICGNVIEHLNEEIER